MVMPETKVPVEIGGRRLYLRYSLASLETAQRALGLLDYASLLERFDAVLTLKASPEDNRSGLRFDLTTFAVLLWSGLLESMEADGQEVLNLKAIVRSIETRDLPHLLTAMGTALSLSMFDGEKPDQSDPGSPPGVATAAA